jgi:hypothetical protein
MKVEEIQVEYVVQAPDSVEDLVCRVYELLLAGCVTTEEETSSKAGRVVPHRGNHVVATNLRKV